MCDVCKVLKLQRWLYWLHLLKVDSTSNVYLSHITAWSFTTFSFIETKEENRKQSNHSFCPFSYPNNLYTVPNICPSFLSYTSQKFCSAGVPQMCTQIFWYNKPFCYPRSPFTPALFLLPYDENLKVGWEKERGRGKNVSTSSGQLKSLLLKTWQPIQPLKVLTQGNAWNVYSLINLLGGDLKFPHSWICGWQRDFSVVTSYLNNRAKRLC